MEEAPGSSLVEQAGSVAALEATYRFFANRRVIPEAIFEGRAVKTVERAAAHERVLIVHDTTEFRFGGAKCYRPRRLMALRPSLVMDIVHVDDVLAITMPITQVPRSSMQTRVANAAMPIDRMGDGHHALDRDG